MQKKSQTMMLSIITAITIFIIGMVAITFLQDEIDRARLPENLDCANENNFTAGGLSSGAKLTCLAVGVAMPYYILLIVSVSGGIIVARLAI